MSKMTREEKLAYGRGYNAGSRGYWPEHRPPTPPEPVVARMMLALRSLRDAADYWCATCDPDQPETEGLRNAIDAADEAMTAMGKWLKAADDPVP